jgi:hypothetical protein
MQAASRMTLNRHISKTMAKKAVQAYFAALAGLYHRKEGP